MSAAPFDTDSGAIGGRLSEPAIQSALPRAEAQIIRETSRQLRAQARYIGVQFERARLEAEQATVAGSSGDPPSATQD